MNEVTRRHAIKFVTTAGAVTAASGVLCSRRASAEQKSATEKSYGYVDEPPNNEEKKAFEVFKSSRAKGVGLAEGAPKELISAIPIPYALPLGAVNMAGILYVREPLEDSSTDGAAVGAINGSYHLDKNKAATKLYDPTGALLKVEMELSFGEKRLKGRICTRSLGGWRCSDWQTLASW